MFLTVEPEQPRQIYLVGAVLSFPISLSGKNTPNIPEMAAWEKDGAYYNQQSKETGKENLLFWKDNCFICITQLLSA
ncbi:MAG: hypothetical protein ACN6PD_01475 [Sphingobacterium sp.]